MFQSPHSRGTTELSIQLLGRNDLVTWAWEEHGVELTHDETGLGLLDDHLDEWRDDPLFGPKLGNEAGLFLGGVLVSVVDGARWVAWPNGHPVVRLSSGRDVDATALAAQRILSESTSLLHVLVEARRG